MQQLPFCVFFSVSLVSSWSVMSINFKRQKRNSEKTWTSGQRNNIRNKTFSNQADKINDVKRNHGYIQTQYVFL